jgi:2-keto-3-deoxy-6-phosphogluconate aldolase
MDILRFKKRPVMGILRCSGYLPAEELVEAIISSGLETIEIAMNSESASLAKSVL